MLRSLPLKTATAILGMTTVVMLALLYRGGVEDVSAQSSSAGGACSSGDQRPSCMGVCLRVGVVPEPGTGCFSAQDCCKGDGTRQVVCTSRQICTGSRTCQVEPGACVYQEAALSSEAVIVPVSSSSVAAVVVPTPPPTASLGSPLCGNATIDPGEDCDNGSVCTDTVASCNQKPGTQGMTCLANPDGTDADVSYQQGCKIWECGDGVINNFVTYKGKKVNSQLMEEVCDDGNTVAGDGCSPLCQKEPQGQNVLCGNHVLDTSEECDDGNNGDGDGCSAACTLETGAQVQCGDGIVTVGERCDVGSTCTSEAASCNRPAGTRLSYCTCNPKNPNCAVGPVTYDVGCSYAVCGDGIVNNWAVSNNFAVNYEQIQEQCDDKNRKSGDGCSAYCQLESVSLCGNTRLDPGETCDDGNAYDADGCSATCQLKSLALCGNRSLESAEQCDDGNRIGGDGCSATCLRELTSQAVCGNAQVDAGEQCDDGKDNSDSIPDTCRTTCLASYCGDRVVDKGEACDDGNLENGDGCSQACTLERRAASKWFTLPFLGGNQPVDNALINEVRDIAMSHPAAGRTGPEVLVVMAGGAALGYAWLRRRRK